MTEFLTYLAADRGLAPSTLTQALAALQFLYREILGQPIAVGNVPTPRAPVRLPVVLTADEVRRVLGDLRGVHRFIGMILYGSGLRLLECLSLRVKDVDVEGGEIRVRRGKGAKDRVTVLADTLRRPLGAHLERVRALHQRDMAAGGGWVEIPGGLSHKYPNAGRTWPWQWIFPAARQHTDRESSQRRRHHLHESAHLPAFLRYPPAGGGLRYQDGPGAVRAPGRGDDDAVHSCPQPRTARCSQPVRPRAFGRSHDGLAVLRTSFPAINPQRRSMYSV